jgi:hypothetical protein
MSRLEQELRQGRCLSAKYVTQEALGNFKVGHIIWARYADDLCYWLRNSTTDHVR